MAAEAAHRTERRRQPRYGFEKQSRLHRHITQGGDEPRQHAGGNWRGWMSHHIAQPAPTVGVRAIHRRPDAGRSQAQ
jgi:hypothetical protein